MAVAGVATPTAPARLAPIDRLTLGYLAVALAFTLVQGPRTLPAVVLLPLALLVAALLAGVIAPRARRNGPVGQLVAEFYPLLVTLAFYMEVGLVNAARGVSHDSLVQRWERALFGGQVSMTWLRSFPSAAWSTLMHAAYVSFYLILAGAPLGLWCSRRREAARRTLLLLMATLYVCYAAFLVFPVAGPRYLFPHATNAANAVPVAAFTHQLLETFSAWGTAFPSSHVAAALVVAVCAWRGWRPLGAVLVPAALLLTVATVYGQFHYAVDALAGAALALVVLVLSARRRQYDSGPAQPSGARRTS